MLNKCPGGTVYHDPINIYVVYLARGGMAGSHKKIKLIERERH
jgi:hypothetical protein